MSDARADERPEARARRVLIVLPAFDEEETIADVVRGLPRTLPGVDRVEVLVVDDGSTDATAARAREAGAEVVSHGTNRGLGLAFQTALAEALERRVDLMVNVDADGQFRPADVAELVAPVVSGEADFVAGDRFSGGRGRPENMPRVKYYGNLLMCWLVGRIAGRRFPDVSSGFRAYSRRALLWLNLHGDFTYTQESFLDLATKDVTIRQVPVAVRYERGRRSKVARSVLKYAARTGVVVLRTFRDHQPLRFFGLLGAVFFALGLATGSFIVHHYAVAGSFTPYKFVAFTSAYLGTLGIVVWIVGLLADMLDRLRANQERILYWQKRAALDGPAETAPAADGGGPAGAGSPAEAVGD